MRCILINKLAIALFTVIILLSLAMTIFTNLARLTVRAFHSSLLSDHPAQMQRLELLFPWNQTSNSIRREYLSVLSTDKTTILTTLYVT